MAGRYSVRFAFAQGGSLAPPRVDPWNVIPPRSKVPPRRDFPGDAAFPWTGAEDVRMAKKDGDVELLAGGDPVEAPGKDGKKVAGPKLGDDAPLYGKEPDLPCDFSFSKGLVAVELGRATDELEFDRAQATFFVGIMVAYKQQLKANRRGGADADGDEIESLKDIVLRKGKVVVKFTDSKKKHQFTKPEAEYLIARMRPEIKRLPLLKA